jgi:hypothetical protein
LAGRPSTTSQRQHPFAPIRKAAASGLGTHLRIEQGESIAQERPMKKTVSAFALAAGLTAIAPSAHADCSATTLEAALSTATQTFANSSQSISTKQSAFSTLLTVLYPCAIGQFNYASSPGCTGLYTTANGYSYAADYAGLLNGWIQALNQLGDFQLGANFYLGQSAVNAYFHNLGVTFAVMGSCSS